MRAFWLVMVMGMGRVEGNGAVDASGQVTPFLERREGKWVVYFGAAAAWDRNEIWREMVAGERLGGCGVVRGEK